MKVENATSSGKRKFVMEHSHRARLLIADDHTLLAEACKNLLEPEFEVVGIADNGRALLRMASELKPEVVVVDIAMPQLNGLDAADQIKHLLPATKLVFLTMNMSPEVAAEAFRRGASAYVVKSSAAEELVIAIRRALRSESYMSPTITKETVDFLLRSGSSYTEEKRLTPRQSEILQLLADDHDVVVLQIAMRHANRAQLLHDADPALRHAAYRGQIALAPLLVQPVTEVDAVHPVHDQQGRIAASPDEAVHPGHGHPGSFGHDAGQGLLLDRLEQRQGGAGVADVP